jgi:antibiotic biosynthesis monooxygenase (ABM) superfamily enzyme
MTDSTTDEFLTREWNSISLVSLPMKIAYFFFALAAISLTACSTTKRIRPVSAPPGPETVMVTYRVKPGDEAEFRLVLAQAWKIYRKEHLVYAKPHIIIQDMENGNKTRYLEIFMWVNRAAFENAPDAAKTIWQKEHALCEARNGHNDIEGVEVKIVTAKGHTTRWP